MEINSVTFLRLQKKAWFGREPYVCLKNSPIETSSHISSPDLNIFYASLLLSFGLPPTPFDTFLNIRRIWYTNTFNRRLKWIKSGGYVSAQWPGIPTSVLNQGTVSGEYFRLSSTFLVSDLHPGAQIVHFDTLWMWMFPKVHFSIQIS